jgi:hypothetical protein
MSATHLFSTCLTFLINFQKPSANADRYISRFSVWFCALVGFLCFVMLIPGVLVSQTEVEGEVSGEWNVEGSPYVLIGNTSVPENEELRLLPGTEMIFGPEVEFNVHGLFIAQGEEEDSVAITASGFHADFNFLETSSDECAISYCHSDSIHFTTDQTTVTISNSLFYDCEIRPEGGSSDFYNNVLCFDGIMQIVGGRDIVLAGNTFDGCRLQIQTMTGLELRNNATNNRTDLSGVIDGTLTDCVLNRFTASGCRNLSIFNCETPERTLSFSRCTGVTFRGGNYVNGFHLRQTYGYLEIDRVNIEGTLGVDGVVENCTITNSSIHRTSFGGTVTLLAEHNNFYGRFLVGGPGPEIILRDNFNDNLGIEPGNTIVENNTIRAIGIGNADGAVIRNNRILESISCSMDGQPFFYRNDIGIWNNSNHSLVEIQGENTRPLFATNTFHSYDNTRDGESLIVIWRSGDAEFYNNLFLGDGFGSRGINIGGTSGNVEGCEVIGDYNCFWGVDPVGVNFEIGEHSYVEDPRIMDRRERDARPTVMSPLIDAGLANGRWERRDPDGTTPDIGCYYFDQREDHPPFIDGEFEIEVDPFSDMVYEASIVDDGEEVEIRFEELPEWLQLTGEEQNGLETIIELTGRPPAEDIDEYTFEIYSTDQNGQTDSLSVHISVNPFRLLSGEIS